MFRKKDSRQFDKLRNVEDDYLLKRREQGFELVERVDITSNVSPTLDIVRMAKEEYVTPLMSVAGNARRWKLRIARLLFRKEMGQLRRIHRYYEDFSYSIFFSHPSHHFKFFF